MAAQMFYGLPMPLRIRGLLANPDSKPVGARPLQDSASLVQSQIPGKLFDPSSNFLSRVALYFGATGVALKVARKKVASAGTPWRELSLTSMGDHSALVSFLTFLDGADIGSFPGLVDATIAAARMRPAEGGLLLKNLFARAGNADRLRIIDAVVSDPNLDHKRLVGDLFVALMARSTPEERRMEIYPGLKVVLSTGSRHEFGRGLLRALFHGWLLEDENLTQGA